MAKVTSRLLFAIELLATISIGCFQASADTPAVLAQNDLSPFVQMVTPTNGTVFQVSDYIYPFDIQVHSADPEGHLENTIVYLDGQSISTNALSDFIVSPLIPVPGEHRISAVARDASGLSSTNQVSFSVVQDPHGIFPIYFRLEDGKLILTFTGHLQSSADMSDWVEEPGASPVTRVPDAQRRFYRARE